MGQFTKEAYGLGVINKALRGGAKGVRSQGSRVKNFMSSGGFSNKLDDIINQQGSNYIRQIADPMSSRVNANRANTVKRVMAAGGAGLPSSFTPSSMAKVRGKMQAGNLANNLAEIVQEAETVGRNIAPGTLRAASGIQDLASRGVRGTANFARNRPLTAAGLGVAGLGAAGIGATSMAGDYVETRANEGAQQGLAEQISSTFGVDSAQIRDAYTRTDEWLKQNGLGGVRQAGAVLGGATLLTLLLHFLTR